MLIGDNKQAIYAFRGAVPKFIIEHKEWLTDSKVMHLSKNFRSSKNIVKAANTLMNNSIDDDFLATNVNMIPENYDGAPVFVHEMNSCTIEADFIIERIEYLVKEGPYSYADIAVLYSKNYVSKTVVKSLKKAKIPYVQSSEKDFWERAEIKKIISFFMLIDDPKSPSHFKNVCKNAKITELNVERMIAIADFEMIDYIEILERFEDDDFKESREQLVKIFNYIKYRDMSIYLKIEYIIKEFDLIAKYEKQKTENSTKIIENLNKLVEFASSDEEITLDDFVYQIVLKTSLDHTRETNVVKLLSIHSSKGLEYKVVFVIGIEEGVLPDYRAITKEELEEQRRLLFVAMTRAKEELHLSFARKRLSQADKEERAFPSYFLKEIGHVKNLRNN